ncbi:MAG: cyclic nucleotide-binding domain-containing protein [Calditrichia bacterium]
MFQIAEVLKKVPFFQTLGRDGIDFIVERLKFKPYDGEELICQAGDPGDKMYIVINGEVKVVVSSDGGEEKVIAYLATGDYFGEMSLLTGEPRSASVVTTKTSEMFVLNKNDFDVIIEKFPSITLSMSKIMSQRLRETNQKAANAAPDKSSNIKGELSEKSLVDVMKFCEENSLNGKVLIQNGDDKGQLHYEKGELQKVALSDKPEDQALDSMLKWKVGQFVVEPRPMKLDEKEQKKPTPPAEPHRIIIVNNSMVVQKILQRAFDSMGYEVYAIEKSSKALTMIKSMKPNLIISDTKLPDSSGSEFLASAREVSQVPIVMLTEQSNRAQFENDLKNNSKVFFTNSQEVGEVVKVVENALK